MNLAANIEISLNDQHVRIPPDVTLKTLLELKHVRAERGVAVAVNGEVVPRDRWDNTILHALDNVVVISATQGG